MDQFQNSSINEKSPDPAEIDNILPDQAYQKSEIPVPLFGKPLAVLLKLDA